MTVYRIMLCFYISLLISANKFNQCQWRKNNIHEGATLIDQARHTQPQLNVSNWI